MRERFVCDPEESQITVYDPETLDENGEPVVIEPEEDESYRLLPGTYRYDTAAGGLNAWTSALLNGTQTGAAVISGFAGSAEFQGICADAGITAGWA